ncbi:MAG: NAD(P)-dependent oxidoreductase [Actinomycetota bacterium]
MQEAGTPGSGGRRVLVTGATGYLGANVAALLADPGVAEVEAGGRGPQAGEALVGAPGTPARLSLVSGRLPEAPWSLDGVDSVVHIAGVRPGIGVDETRILLVNQEGTWRLLERIAGRPVQRVVFVSAQSVHGWRRPPQWGEAMAVRPQTAYGLSKWVGECMCRSLEAEIGVAALRLAMVYGLGGGTPPGMDPDAASLCPAARPGGDHPGVRHRGAAPRPGARVRRGRGGAPRRREAGASPEGAECGGEPVTTRRVAESSRRAAEELGLPAPDFGLDIGGPAGCWVGSPGGTRPKACENR